MFTGFCSVCGVGMYKLKHTVWRVEMYEASQMGRSVEKTCGMNGVREKLRASSDCWFVRKIIKDSRLRRDVVEAAVGCVLRT